jgi:hypothetical protein
MKKNSKDRSIEIQLAVARNFRIDPSAFVEPSSSIEHCSDSSDWPKYLGYFSNAL